MPISHNLMHLQFSINAKKIKNQFITKLENWKSLEDFFWSEIMAWVLVPNFYFRWLHRSEKFKKSILQMISPKVSEMRWVRYPQHHPAPSVTLPCKAYTAARAEWCSSSTYDFTAGWPHAKLPKSIFSNIFLFP